jgi:flagellar L-ring protein precursor FlgH
MQKLEHDLDYLPPVPRPARASGSIWTDGGPGAAMARDTRAFRVNDLVTIKLNERSSGSNQSDTNLERSSENDFGASVFLGLEDPNPTIGQRNLNQVLKSSSSSKFEGDGKTSRSNLLTGNVTTRVMRVLPNGDLMIAGQKTVMVNRERQVLTLVGTVRPVDIDADNRVASSTVGDLTVRLWGRGEIDATVKQGWFQRVMNLIWPF